MRRGALAALAALGLSLWPRAARAELAADLHARTSYLALTDASASSPYQPSVLSSPRLSASGRAQGLGLRILGQGGAVRVGFGEGFFWSDGVSFQARAAPGYSTEVYRFWGGNLELFAGARRRFRGFSVYADLRAALYVMQTTVALRQAAQGFVGDSQFVSLRGDVGPRIGAMFYLGSVAFLDLSAQASPPRLFGPERFSFALGLGVRAGSL